MYHYILYFVVTEFQISIQFMNNSLISSSLFLLHAMARKLANTEGEHPGTKPGEKALVTRRKYLKIGAVTSGAALVSGSGFAGLTAGSEGGEIFTTDFTEYAQ